MERRPVYGDKWSESCLEHATRMVEDVYQRTRARQVSWSPVKQPFHAQHESCANISFEEAFTTMVRNLHHISRDCHKYHANREMVKEFEDAAEHSRRFHRPPKPQPRPQFRGNPFQREGTVHLTLPEGAYAITAHKPSSGVQQTNIVQVADEKNIALHFNL